MASNEKRTITNSSADEDDDCYSSLRVRTKISKISDDVELGVVSDVEKMVTLDADVACEEEVLHVLTIERSEYLTKANIGHFNNKENENFKAEKSEILYIRGNENMIEDKSENSDAEESGNLQVEDKDNVKPGSGEYSEEEKTAEEKNDKTHDIEVYNSRWWCSAVCAMLWKESAISRVAVYGAKAETKPELIGVQLSNNARRTACPFFVDQTFRSDQIEWDLKALESQRKGLGWEMFKMIDSCTKEKYSELFNSRTSLTDTDNETAEDRCNDERDCQADKLEVEIKRSTYRQATIEWKVDSSVSVVDRWLVVIRNDGRTPSNSSDQKKTAEWMILLKSRSSDVTFRIDDDLVLLEYQAGHQYSVQVIGLKLKYEDSPNITCYSVVAFSDTSFRAEHSEEDLIRLLSKARGVREHLGNRFASSDSRRCNWLYRDKPKQYFEDLKRQDNNVMKVYVKDANGDPAAAIQGHLNGLFFSANINFRTGQPLSPRFGDVRVKIPPEKILTENTNMYFGDFYCLNQTHLVTLVVTRSNSEADEFCKKKKLPLLSRTEDNNPFLYFSSDGSVFVSSRITVEVFYTEDINLNELSSQYNGEWEHFNWWENNRKGDKWKREDCFTCNLYTSPLPGALIV